MQENQAAGIGNGAGVQWNLPSLMVIAVSPIFFSFALLCFIFFIEKLHSILSG